MKTAHFIEEIYWNYISIIANIIVPAYCMQ